MPRTKTCLPSVEATFLNTMSLCSRNPSDWREKFAARAKCRFRRLSGLAYEHVLPQQEEETLRNGKKRSAPPMTTTDFHLVKERNMTKRARFDFRLPPTSLYRKESHKNGRRESFRRVKTVMDPASKKGMRLEKLRHA